MATWWLIVCVGSGIYKIYISRVVYSRHVLDRYSILHRSVSKDA